MGIAYNTSIVRDGLVLHLDAANVKSYPGSGTTWNDMSGNGNNGTLVNGVGYSSDNNGSLTFDGSNDYVSLSTSFLPNQLFADSSGSWTVSAWFRFPVSPVGTKTTNASWAIIGRAGGIATAGSFILYVGSQTDPTYGQYAPFKTAVTIRGAVTVMSDSVNTNTWNNIVLAWNGSVGNYYFNTNQGSLNIGTAALQSYGDFFIGSNIEVPTNHYFSGDISQVKIYNRSLTASEIKQNFEATRGRYGI
jgi:hypothetical protein